MGVRIKVGFGALESELVYYSSRCSALFVKPPTRFRQSRILRRKCN